MVDHLRPALKRATGWFAAGREVLRAVPLLSDGAFKLYIHVCLHADRATGQLASDYGDLAKALNKSRRSIGAYIEELQRLGVCEIRPAHNQHRAGEIEICDTFWPYHKVVPGTPTSESLAGYKERIRSILRAQRCVKASWTPADEKLAEGFFQQNIPIELIEHAVLLGCARKYVTLINGETASPITSLSYFRAVIDEVSDLRTSTDYWRYLAQRVHRLERQWLDREAKPGQPAVHN